MLGIFCAIILLSLRVSCNQWYYHIAVRVLVIILIPIPRRLSIELVGLSQLRVKSVTAMSREWWTTGIIDWYHMIFSWLGSGYHDILISTTILLLSTTILLLSWLPFFKDGSQNTFLGPSDCLVHLHGQVESFHSCSLSPTGTYSCSGMPLWSSPWP